MLTSILKNMGLNDKDFKAKLKKSKYEINDFNIYNYIYNPGVPLYISNKREVIMDLDGNNNSRIDTIEIELID